MNSPNNEENRMKWMEPKIINQDETNENELTSWRQELECFLFSSSLCSTNNRFFLRYSSRRWRWIVWIISYMTPLVMGKILSLIFSITLGIVSLLMRVRCWAKVLPKSIRLSSGNASYCRITSFYIKFIISVNEFIVNWFWYIYP